MRRFLMPLLLGAAFTNPSQLKYNYNATGSASRQMSSKLSDVVNVKDFGAAGSGSVDDAPAINAAIAALPFGGIIHFPIGSYRLDTAVTVNVIGIAFQGDGFGSQFVVNHTGDVFNVTAQLFRMENMEVQVLTSAARSSAIIHGQGSQGYVNNVRFSGSPTSTNNGYIFLLDAENSDLWEFDHVRVTGGATYTGVWRFARSTGISVASTRISNFVFVNGLVSVAIFDIDGAIDTVHVVNSDFPTFGGKAIWVRNSVGAGFSPRWIHFDNCFTEGGGGGGVWGTAIQLDAVRDFRYTGGYIASASIGVAVGASASEVGIVNTEFVNMQQSAVTIAAGATSTTLAHDSFEDTGNLTDNTYDTIAIAANTNDFLIDGNRFRSALANKPRYSIGVAPGTSDNYRIVNNYSTNTSTGILNITSVTGTHRNTMGNHGLNGLYQGDTFQFNSGVLFTTTITNGGGGQVPTAGITCSNSAACGTTALVSGSPSTKTVTVTSGTNCVCTNTTTQANPVKCSVSSTTLTITGPNTVTDTIAYFCF